MLSFHNKGKKERKYAKTFLKNHKIFIKSSLYLLKHDRQTDGQNNVKTRCAYVIEIFPENFSFLSVIAAEKIAFPL